MVFALRVDIESDLGIREGVPKILNLAKKLDVKVSFYLTMGGESNIFQILAHRKKLPGVRKVKVFSNIQKARMLLLPRDFVSRNKVVLQRILDEGHELGIHGYKHRAWTRSLDKIDINKHITKAVNKYKKIFGLTPTTFCAPAFQTNEHAQNILKQNGINIISDLDQDKPRIIDNGLINIPITIRGTGNTPILEYLTGEGKSDGEIYKYMQDQIDNKKYAIMYIHGLYEAREKIPLIEKILTYAKKKGKVKTIQEIAKDAN
jgi:undecaprenyl phosphate-alpha-L-ara4FN deformylase